MPDAANLKLERLKKISTWIAKDLTETKIVNVDFLKVRCCFEIGLSVKKAEEYIKLCVDAHEDWIEQKGSILLKKAEA